MSTHPTTTPSIDNHSTQVAPSTSRVAGKAKEDPNYPKKNLTSNAKPLHHLAEKRTRLLHLEEETAYPSKFKVRRARRKGHNNDADLPKDLRLRPRPQ
jgi:hypothetical protein